MRARCSRPRSAASGQRRRNPSALPDSHGPERRRPLPPGECGRGLNGPSDRRRQALARCRCSRDRLQFQCGDEAHRELRLAEPPTAPLAVALAWQEGDHRTAHRIARMRRSSAICPGDGSCKNSELPPRGTRHTAPLSLEWSRSSDTGEQHRSRPALTHRQVLSRIELRENRPDQFARNVQSKQLRQ